MFLSYSLNIFEGIHEQIQRTTFYEFILEMARGDNLRSYYYRFTVEDCLTFTLGQLYSIRSREFRDFVVSKTVGDYATSKIELWEGGDIKGNILAILRRENNGLKLILGFNYDRTPIEQRIHLSTVKLKYGGIRFYLHCPSCGHRGDKLYLVPNRKRFLCRACGNLTYQSCKQSEGITSFEKTIAAMGNISIHEVKLFSNCLRKTNREAHKTYLIEKPYNQEDKMHTTTIKLGNKQNKELKELSKELDLPKSELIRIAVDRYLDTINEKKLNDIKYNQN